MPLTGQPSHDISELTHANARRAKPRSRRQIIAIALAERRKAKNAADRRPVRCATPQDHAAMWQAIAALGRKWDAAPLLVYSDMLQEEGHDHLADAIRRGVQWRAEKRGKSPFESRIPEWSVYGKHPSGAAHPMIYMHHRWSPGGPNHPSRTASVSLIIGNKRLNYDTTDLGHVRGLLGEMHPFHEREQHYGSRQSIDAARRQLDMPPWQPPEGWQAVPPERWATPVAPVRLASKREAVKAAIRKAAPTFYSHARRVIEAKVPNVADANQIRKTLLNNGVKPDELKYSGAEAFLNAAGGPVTKESLLAAMTDSTPDEKMRGRKPADAAKVAAAEARLADAEARHDETTANLSRLGQELKRFDAKIGEFAGETDPTQRQRIALEYANEYGRQHGVPARSRLAGFSYGGGGQDQQSWDVYSKAHHRSYGPARWKDAGVWVTDDGQLLIENSNGKIVHRVPFADVLRARGMDPDAPAAGQELADLKAQRNRVHNEYLSLKENVESAAAERKRAQAALSRAKRGGSGLAPKYENYSLPGGGGYRELLLTLPVRKQEARLPDKSKWTATVHNENPYTGQRDVEIKDENGEHVLTRFGSRVAPEQVLDDAYNGRAEEAKLRAEQGDTFQSSHWDEPNVLAHVRFKDFVGPHGEKLLHVDELQSDWHQQGRERGYRSPLSSDEERELNTLRAKEGKTTEEWNRQQSLAERQITGRDSKSPPDAPFKKSWHELALRRMVRYAADRGYDALSWSPGAVQADRYNLATRLKELHWYDNNDGTYSLSAVAPNGQTVDDRQLLNIKAQDLPGVVGKDVADRIVAGHGRKWGVDEQVGGEFRPHTAHATREEANRKADELRSSFGGDYRTGPHPTEGVLTGEGLSVGGSGMRGFYDKIVPDYLNRYGRRWGASVGQTTIESGGKPLTVPVFPIPEAMKESVRKEGQVLFANERKAVRLAVPVSDHAAFRAAIDANPHDAAPWGIYADYLDEQGMHGHAHAARHLGGMAKDFHQGRHGDESVFPALLFNQEAHGDPGEYGGLGQWPVSHTIDTSTGIGEWLGLLPDEYDNRADLATNFADQGNRIGDPYTPVWAFRTGEHGRDQYEFDRHVVAPRATPSALIDALALHMPARMSKRGGFRQAIRLAKGGAPDHRRRLVEHLRTNGYKVGSDPLLDRLLAEHGLNGEGPTGAPFAEPVDDPTDLHTAILKYPGVAKQLGLTRQKLAAMNPEAVKDLARQLGLNVPEEAAHEEAAVATPASSPPPGEAPQGQPKAGASQLETLMAELRGKPSRTPAAPLPPGTHVRGPIVVPPKASRPAAKAPAAPSAPATARPDIDRGRVESLMGKRRGPATGIRFHPEVGRHLPLASPAPPVGKLVGVDGRPVPAAPPAITPPPRPSWLDRTASTARDWFGREWGQFKHDLSPLTNTVRRAGDYGRKMLGLPPKRLSRRERVVRAIRLSRGLTPVRLMRDLDHFLGGFLDRHGADDLAEYLESQGRPYTAEAFRRAHALHLGYPHPLDGKHLGTAASEAFTEGFHDDDPRRELRNAMIQVGVITRPESELHRPHTQGFRHVIRLRPMLRDDADVRSDNRWVQPDIQFDTNDHELARGLLMELPRVTTGDPGEHAMRITEGMRGPRRLMRAGLVRAIRLSRGLPVRNAAHDDPPLLHAIAANPWDDAGHLILADSLEEQGSPFGPMIRQYANGERNNDYWDWRDNEPNARSITADDLYHPEDNALGFHEIGRHGPFHLWAQPSGFGGREQAPLRLLALPAARTRQPFNYNFELSPHEVRQLAGELGGDLGSRLEDAARHQWIGGGGWYRQEGDPPARSYDEIVAGPRPERMSLRSAFKAAVRLSRGLSPVRLARLPDAEVHPEFRVGGVAPRLGHLLQSIAGETGEGDNVNETDTSALARAALAAGPDDAPLMQLADALEERDHPHAGTVHWRNAGRGMRMDRALWDTISRLSRVRTLPVPGLTAAPWREGAMVYQRVSPGWVLSDWTGGTNRPRLPRRRALAAVRTAAPDATLHDLHHSIERLLDSQFVQRGERNHEEPLGAWVLDRTRDSLRQLGSPPANPFEYPAAVPPRRLSKRDALVGAIRLSKGLAPVRFGHAQSAASLSAYGSGLKNLSRVLFHPPGELHPDDLRTVGSGTLAGDGFTVGVHRHPGDRFRVSVVHAGRHLGHWWVPQETAKAVWDELAPRSVPLFPPGGIRRMTAEEDHKDLLQHLGVGLPERAGHVPSLEHEVFREDVVPTRVMGRMDRGQRPVRLGLRDMYGWLTPEGGFHVVEGPTHESWIRRTFPSMDDAFKKGWQRVTFSGPTLYAHNDHLAPNRVQRDYLESLAIREQMKRLVHATGPEGKQERHLWGERERFSRRVVNAIRLSKGLPVRMSRENVWPLTQSVAENPHDHAPWLILADALEEAGKPATALGIREVVKGDPLLAPRQMVYQPRMLLGSGPGIPGHVATMPVRLVPLANNGWRLHVQSQHEGGYPMGVAELDRVHGDAVLHEMEAHTPEQEWAIQVARSWTGPERMSNRLRRAIRMARDPNKPHKYACALVRLTGEAAKRIKALAKSVADADLADDGREGDPHVTLFFGLHPSADLTEKVREVAASFGRPIKGRVTGMSAFYGADTGKDYDVLKFNVESDDLHELNRMLGELPSTRTHKEYKPHATVCYVKAGKAKQYMEGVKPLNADFTADSFLLADVNREKTPIKLNRARVIRLAARADRPVSVGGASERVGSANHDALVQALRQTLTRSGLDPNRVVPAVHDVSGQARAAAVAEVFGEHRPHAADYGAAWQGLVAKLPGLVVFRRHPEGEDSVYHFGFRGPVTAMAGLLDGAGVSNRIFVPHGDATRVYLYDRGRKLRDSVGSLLGTLGITAAEHVGTGRPLGGGDDLGRADYRDEIRGYEGQGPDRSSAGRRPVRLASGPRLLQLPDVRQQDNFSCILPSQKLQGRVIGGSKARYSGEAVEIHTARGAVLSVTANHPVLTVMGFVAAGDLKKGQNLLNYAGEDQSLATGDYEQNAPALVEDVFDSFLNVAGAVAASQEVRCTPLDFHGDAKFFQGQIEVVGSYSQLRRHVVPDCQEGFNQSGLNGSGSTLVAEACCGGFDLGLNGPFASKGCSVGRNGLTDTGRSVHSAPDNLSSLARVANGDAVVAEGVLEQLFPDALVAGQLLKGNPLVVEADDVVEVWNRGPNPRPLSGPRQHRRANFSKAINKALAADAGLGGEVVNARAFVVVPPDDGVDVGYRDSSAVPPDLDGFGQGAQTNPIVRKDVGDRFPVNTQSRRQVGQRFSADVLGNDALDTRNAPVLPPGRLANCSRLPGVVGVRDRNPSCFGRASHLDVTIPKHGQNGVPPDAVLVLQLLNGTSGAVIADEIVEIRRFHYEGPVYDFETSTGWMVVGNLCISNCGAAAAMSVGRYFGVGPKTLPEWKKALGTSAEQSTRPDRIVAYLKSLGLSVEAKEGMTVADLAAATDSGRPVICPVQDYGPAESKKAEFQYGHYLTLTGVGERMAGDLAYVFVQDSSEKNALEGQGSISADDQDMIREDVWDKNWHDKDVDGHKYVRYGIVVGPKAVRAARERVKAAVRLSRGLPVRMSRFAAMHDYADLLRGLAEVRTARHEASQYHHLYYTPEALDLFRQRAAEEEAVAGQLGDLLLDHGDARGHILIAAARDGLQHYRRSRGGRAGMSSLRYESPGVGRIERTGRHLSVYLPLAHEPDDFGLSTSNYGFHVDVAPDSLLKIVRDELPDEARAALFPDGRPGTRRPRLSMREQVRQAIRFQQPQPHPEAYRSRIRRGLLAKQPPTAHAGKIMSLVMAKPGITRSEVQQRTLLPGDALTEAIKAMTANGQLKEFRPFIGQGKAPTQLFTAEAELPKVPPSRTDQVAEHARQGLSGVESARLLGIRPTTVSMLRKRARVRGLLSKGTKPVRLRQDSPRLDAAGGVVPTDLKVAKRVDLITLPEGVDGTRCSNCEWAPGKDGLCKNKEVRQPVNGRNCCALWSAPGTLRAFKMARGAWLHPAIRLMRDATAFSTAMAENPSDHAPRLVFADYLEEQGYPAVAEAIRRQSPGFRTAAEQSAPIDDRTHIPVGFWASFIGPDRLDHRDVPLVTVGAYRHPESGRPVFRIGVNGTDQGQMRGRPVASSYLTHDAGLVSRLLDENPPSPGWEGSHEAMRELSRGGVHMARPDRSAAVTPEGTRDEDFGPKKKAPRPLPEWVPREDPEAEDPSKTGWIWVGSSWIGGLKYDRDNGVSMFVKKGGKTYSYRGFGVKQLRSWLSAQSKGKWYWRNIARPMLEHNASPTRYRLKNAMKRHKAKR